MQSARTTQILDGLVKEGQISAESREAVLNVIARDGGRVEEVLLDMGVLDELTLLKHLAGRFKTRFVSTQKLAKADIDRVTLEKIPKKLAELGLVFPVLFDQRTGVLSVVTPDPDSPVVQQDVRLAAGVKDVKTFIGRPRAVQAAIAKAYNGDIYAFANLDRDSNQQFTTMLDVYERNLVTAESMAVSLAQETTGRERVIDSRDLENPEGATARARGGLAYESYLETLNVLVTLIENTRADLRGHSAHVARLMKKISERIGLPAVELHGMMIAGYVHDLGKMGNYHLTALNAAEYEAHRGAAAKQGTGPSRLLEAVQLPRDILAAVEGMYERFDGKGLPKGARGKEIPLGSRLLAIADTYADLTQNPRNPFRKKLKPVEACDVIGRYRGKIFDPNLVDLFRHTVLGEDIKARLLSDRHHAMIIDPDPEEATVLEVRMIEQGFEVTQVHASDQALKVLEQGEIDVVVAELDLKPFDGFALLSEARKQRWGEKLPWIVVSGRGGRADAQRSFELGAADFMAKPISADLLVAKVRQIMEREATRAGGGRGVAGSLTEMGIPDMVQVLWHGRKTGSFKIRAGGEKGEIHFVDGTIYNALWGTLRGEEAFYAMVKLTQGDFVLDPNFRAPQQVIEASPEALLLEGMRRLDEGLT